MKIGVQPEQMQMENMLEEVDIMDSVIIIVQKLDKKKFIMTIKKIKR